MVIVKVVQTSLIDATKGSAAAKPAEAISLKIISRVLGGQSIEDAFNSVLGESAFENLAGEIYKALQKPV